MTVSEALTALGVRNDTLAEDEKAALDRDGFVILRNILTPEQLEVLRERTDDLLAAEGAEAGKEVHQEAGTDRLADLVNKGEVFGVCFTHPRVLAAVAHVLGSDLKLSSINGRNALPGSGHQWLHADWEGGEVPPDGYQVCNTAWLLDDFTRDNGATRLVPGSHRGGRLPEQEVSDPGAPHPDEVIAVAPAGSVLVFNSHTWHGGTDNRTDRPRRALFAYFTRRRHRQQLDQRKYIRPETYARLSKAARYLIDV
jgi:ectoine hydroxylase-related dioxygenase (phytanoyl-CoA dioxygenase family)